MKKTHIKLIDLQGLKRAFAHLNARFFDNRIPGSLNVRYMKKCRYKNQDNELVYVDAYFDQSTDSIVVDEALQNFPDFVVITLLHEMVHADLRFQGYVGYDVDKGHGTRFHGEIARLIRAGAYDGLL